MLSVTSEFAKYDLSEICKEYKDEATKKESQAVLSIKSSSSLRYKKYKTASDTDQDTAFRGRSVLKFL